MKVGLVLGGGGSKGSYQLGVLKSLYEHNMLNDIKIVSGASIGAVNASLVMTKETIEGMDDFWSNINNENVYNQNEEKDGIYDQTIMYETLKSKQDPLKIKNSDVKGYISLSRTTGNSLFEQINKHKMTNELVLINEHYDPHKVILASSSIPVIFGPTIIDDVYYLDGGLTNNLPVEIMVEEECDVILVIGLNPNYDLNKFKGNSLIINYSPEHSLTNSFLGTLNFDNNKEFLDLGYKRANIINNYLKENHYFFNNKFNNKNDLIEFKNNNIVIK